MTSETPKIVDTTTEVVAPKSFKQWESMLKSLYGITAKIVADKRGLSREDWLKVRKGGVGGSEIGPLLGHSKYACAIDVYLDKSGRDDLLKEISEEQQAIMDSGSDMEELILELYRKKTGRKVVAINAILAHPTIDKAYVNVDAIAQADDGTWGVLEVKNSLARGSEWVNGSVPQTYQDQCRQGMWVLGLGWGEVVSLRAGRWGDDSRFPISKDVAWESEAERVIADLWDCVSTKTLPRIPQEVGEGHSIWKEAMARVAGEIPERNTVASPYLTRTIMRYVELKNTIKTAEAEVEALQGIVADEMGGPGEVEYPGGKVSWKQNKPTNSFDRKRFAAEHPALESEFSVVKPGSFVMRVK